MFKYIQHEARLIFFTGFNPLLFSLSGKKKKIRVKIVAILIENSNSFHL